MATVISGKELATLRRSAMKEEVSTFTEKYGRVPHLAVVLVGEDPGSVSYVAGKEKACIEIGIKNTTIRKPDTISQDELLAIINDLNKDDTVDGILVQLPLPKHMDPDFIINAIIPEKDVDGFHPVNVGRLSIGEKGFVSCTPAGVIELLKRSGTELDGANAVVVGRSNIVGKPLIPQLLQKNATVTICHSKTQNLKEETKIADVVIMAIGKAKFLKKEDIKEGAILIDVGINFEDGKIVGDIDFEDVKEKASMCTPVPGGIGTITNAVLIRNIIESCEKL